MVCKLHCTLPRHLNFHASLADIEGNCQRTIELVLGGLARKKGATFGKSGESLILFWIVDTMGQENLNPRSLVTPHIA